MSNAKNAVADPAGGSVPTDDTGPDNMPDAKDAELLQEQMKGDEASVEELEEKLPPLYVPSYACVTSLSFCHSSRFRRAREGRMLLAKVDGHNLVAGGDCGKGGD
jgi:hypothetical protein